MLSTNGKKKKNHVIYRYFPFRDLISLNSPVACFTPDVLNLFTKEDQVFNYI